MPSQLSERIGELIEKRDRGNIKQASRRTGLAYTTLYGIVRGGEENPKIETLEAVAKGYGIPLDDLLHAEPAPPNAPTIPRIAGTNLATCFSRQRSSGAPFVSSACGVVRRRSAPRWAPWPRAL